MTRNPTTVLFALLAGLAVEGAAALAQSSQPAAPPGVAPATHAAHLAQNPAAHTGGQPSADADLVKQIAALRAEVAKLQAALAQGHTALAPANAGRGTGIGGMGITQKRIGSGQMQPMQPQPMPGTGGMSGGGGQPAGGGMAGMSGGSGMGGTAGGDAGGGGMGMDGMMKMMGKGSMPMGGAGSPAATAMPSALPGFPGASHIYHVGATGFFLDHPDHITLEQQTALSQKKEQALLQQAEFQRKIEQAEQELWVLTAADQPDAAAIEQKTQEIAHRQGEQRVAFIRAVGESAKVLTDEQRKQLTAMLPPAPTPMAPAAPGMPAGVDPATHAAHLKQNPAAHATSAPAGAQPGAAGDANADPVNQIAALRAEVAKLQAALAHGHTAQAPANAGRETGMGGMGMTQKRMGSGQMQPIQPMQPQPTPGAGGMAGMSGGGGPLAGGGMEGMSGGGGGGGMDMDGMMEMMGMGSMPMGGAGSPAAMNMPSALPGFPGASHIYHVGATGFFLDHPDHITLMLEQQTALSQKKEQALLQQAEFQRKIEQAEQELWVLTAADQPDTAAIEKKVHEIAKLQGDQRVAFIRAVGEAAKVLTDEQRKQLTGMLPPAPTQMAPAAPGMSAGGGIGDM